MMPTAPVPAAATGLDPLLMPRRGTAPRTLSVPVSQLRVLVLGLSPITAAAAVMLAGCGVRGFTVVDDGWVTWSDARAGAFDSTEVGRSRDLCTRRRIRAANAEAAPVTWTDDAVTDDRPGRVVLRSCRAWTGGGELSFDLPGDHLPLPEQVPLVDVLSLSAGATLLTAEAPWHRRPCPSCLRATAEQAMAPGGSGPDVGSMAPRAAGPAHTAFCAALVVEAVLADTTGTGAALRPEGARWLLHPGRPLSTRTAAAGPASSCALCGA